MKIIHALRAPVGGLFRHVVDLAGEQARAGHQIGIICDSDTGGARADEALEKINDACSLGIIRTPIARLPGLADIQLLRLIRTRLDHLAPDIIHGHGAKGGLMARMLSKNAPARSIYTPHGGVLHFPWHRPASLLYLGTERLLLRYTDGLVFVCDHERAGFHKKIGGRNLPFIVNHNGITAADFAPLRRAADATDIVFIGELRALKGIAYLLQALQILIREQPVTATIVGDGQDRAALEKQAADLGLSAHVRFTGALPALEALRLGRIFVLSSLHESFPYVILEAAAQALPIVATNVGGVSELISAEELVPPANADALAEALRDRLKNFSSWQARAKEYRDYLSANLTVEKMAAHSLEFYRTVLDS